MAEVFNNIKKADGLAQDDFNITVELSWDKSQSPVAYEGNNSVMISGAAMASTDSDGRWSVNLTPNSEITPLGTFYKVTETQSDGALSEVYYIEVPDTASVWVGEIIVSKPSWEA
jgi:hypothetical protein